MAGNAKRSGGERVRRAAVIDVPHGLVFGAETPGHVCPLGDHADGAFLHCLRVNRTDNVIADVSVAYHAKPVVRERATCRIDYCGLDAVVNLFV